MNFKEIKFKEHSQIDLFASKEDIDQDLFCDYKTNLIAISNTYGLVIIGFQNCMFILNYNK